MRRRRLYYFRPQFASRALDPANAITEWTNYVEYRTLSSWLGRGVREGVRRLFRLPIGTRAVASSDADAELDADMGARVEHFVARGMTPHGRPSWTPAIGARASAAGS